MSSRSPNCKSLQAALEQNPKGSEGRSPSPQEKELSPATMKIQTLDIEQHPEVSTESQVNQRGVHIFMLCLYQ